MISLVIKMVLRVLAILLIGFVSAVIGLIVGSIIFTTFIPEIAIMGKEGYEAGGPIGFSLGALIGLIGRGCSCLESEPRDDRESTLDRISFSDRDSVKSCVMTKRYGEWMKGELL